MSNQSLLLRDAEAELERIGVKLVLEEPFYGHLLLGMVKCFSSDTHETSLAHGGDCYHLRINPTFWVKLSRAHRCGVLKHEVLHALFKHPMRQRDFGNRALFNVAADLVVNQYIRKSHLRRSDATLASFRHLELPPDADVGTYYRALLDEERGAGAASAGSPIGGGDGDDTAADMGDASPADGPDLFDSAHPNQRSHATWAELGQSSTSERERIAIAFEDAAAAALSRIEDPGALPRFIRERLDALVASRRPSVDWRRALRMFTESAAQTYLKTTMKRPSKRYGVTPGIRIRKRHKIACVIDTSGSLRTESLAAFFSEIGHLWRRQAEVMVVECDADIHRVYRYDGHPPRHIEGRGGTRFDPPLEWANERYHPDALIYFTDGFADVPEVAPRYPVLWLISPDGISSDDPRWQRLPGRVVRQPRPA